jgi:predicted PhzF superfamily epimerase YddE/YHI9
VDVKRRYATADVFTDKMFGGNPVAVILDATGLSTRQMQAMALEFNYSETTFVLPPDDPRHTAKVRIFTPRTEVPFAGHPNVGTAFLLAREKDFDTRSDAGTFVFEEIAGLVPIRLLREGGLTVGAELRAPEGLSRRSMVDLDDRRERLWRIHQGVDMGRPSLLLARTLILDGGVVETYIGGSCVPVLEGSFWLNGDMTPVDAS